MTYSVQFNEDARSRIIETILVVRRARAPVVYLNRANVSWFNRCIVITNLLISATVWQQRRINIFCKKWITYFLLDQYLIKKYKLKHIAMISNNLPSKNVSNSPVHFCTELGSDELYQIKDRSSALLDIGRNPKPI